MGYTVHRLLPLDSGGHQCTCCFASCLPPPLSLPMCVSCHGVLVCWSCQLKCSISQLHRLHGRSLCVDILSETVHIQLLLVVLLIFVNHQIPFTLDHEFDPGFCRSPRESTGFTCLIVGTIFDSGWLGGGVTYAMDFFNFSLKNPSLNTIFKMICSPVLHS